MYRGLTLSCRLWWLGLWESLQLHRCVVLLDLDSSRALWYKLLHCFKVNGGIFLGSVVWWQWVLQPLLSWLLSNFVQPVAGQWATSTFESALQLVYQVVWLAPVYVVTFAVSCSLYSDMAAEAVQVRQRHAASLLAAVQQHGSTAGVAAQESVQQYGSSNGYGSQPGSLSASHPPPSSLATSSSSKGGAAPDVILGGVAQELYRTVLFAVLYGEVWLAGCLPVVGRAVNLICSCWLFAYYAYDYQWALRGISLPDRLAFFESTAPFFAGYGTVMAVITVVLPFYLGAAVMALLFPFFVLVACDSDPARVVHAVLESDQGNSSQRQPHSVSKLDPGAVGGAGGNQGGMLLGRGNNDREDSRSDTRMGALQARRSELGPQAPTGQNSGQAGQQKLGLCRLPLFGAALWPTERLFGVILRGRSSRDLGSSSGKGSKAS